MTAPALDLTGRGLSVERVSSEGGFAALREEWDELLGDSDGAGVFLTWEWLHGWWTHLAADRELLLLAVRAGRQLVALAPLASRPAALLASPPLRCIELLGSGTAGSDHLDVIARRGCAQEAARALAGALSRAGRLIVLARIRGGPSAARVLAAELEELGWHGERRSTEVCPFAVRPAGGFAEYLAGRGAEHRYAFRRKLRALRRRHAVRLDAVRDEAGRPAALQILVDLHRKRWHGRGHSEAFDGVGQLAFHEEFSMLALARGWLRLFVLRLDGRPAAALYGFRHGRVFSFFQSGFDPAFAKESVGLVTMGLAIQAAFDEGADEFDLLHGDEPYKLHWASATRELARLELYPPGARGRISRSVVALATRARRTGRRLLSAAGAR
jgi:CelD/BcsL family acetyltransferase involved in cellulose biosynthesis